MRWNPPLFCSAGPEPGPMWELDACIGLIAVSLLGSVSSSSCLRLEWEGLQCSASSTGSRSSSCATGGLQPPGSNPLSGPADETACAATLQQPTEGAKQQGAPMLLAGQVSWRQVAVHVLRPNQRPASSLATPFAAAAHIFDARYDPSLCVTHSTSSRAGQCMSAWSR